MPDDQMIIGYKPSIPPLRPRSIRLKLLSHLNLQLNQKPYMLPQGSPPTKRRSSPHGEPHEPHLERRSSILPPPHLLLRSDVNTAIAALEALNNPNLVRSHQSPKTQAPHGHRSGPQSTPTLHVPVKFLCLITPRALWNLLNRACQAG